MISVSPLIEPIIASIATKDYTRAILALNKKYLFDNIALENIKKGFIKIPYTIGQLNLIIKRGEIAIAKANNKLIGYYLIGGNCDYKMLSYQKLAANKLAINESVNIERIAYGLQVCIDEKYHNLGLFSSMLEYLVCSVAHKYDYLLCSVSDHNERSLSIHLKSGWKVIDHSAGNNILTYKICN